MQLEYVKQYTRLQFMVSKMLDTAQISLALQTRWVKLSFTGLITVISLNRKIAIGLDRNGAE